MTKCNKDKCNNCTPKQRYCGDPLACLGVVKGEKYDDVFSKINDLFCAGVGNIYEFEESEDCDNGGFDVYQVNGETRVLVYTHCNECCEGLVETVNPPASGDVTFFVTSPPVWTNLNNALPTNFPSYTITESGKYKITVEEGFREEDDFSRFIIGVGKNASAPSPTPLTEFNSKVTKEVYPVIGIRTSVFIIDAVLNDLIKLWVKVTAGGVNVDTCTRLTIEKL